MSHKQLPHACRSSLPTRGSCSSLPASADFLWLGGWWAPWQRLFLVLFRTEVKEMVFLQPSGKSKKNPKPKTIVCVELWHVVPITRSKSAGWVQVPVVGWTQSPGLIQLLMQRCPLLLGVLWGNKAVGYATGCRKDPCSVEVLQDIPVCLSDARWWKASS